MLLSLFFAGRFDEYLDAVRRDSELWLFVHVPKTAGSSLGSELARIAGPYQNIHVDPSRGDLTGPERFDVAVEAFLGKAREQRFRSASGHILERHVARIAAALPGVRPVTLLRDPMKRLVSDYRYQRSPMHPQHAEARRRAPDFAAFLDLPGPRNRMAKHLVPFDLVRKRRIEPAVAHVLERFAFVGLQERYALSFRMLTTLVTGTPQQPTERRRVNEEGEAVALTPELEALARERNALDWAIHDAVAARFAAVEEQLAAWLDARPADAAARQVA